LIFIGLNCIKFLIRCKEKNSWDVDIRKKKTLGNHFDEACLLDGMLFVFLFFLNPHK